MKEKPFQTTDWYACSARRGGIIMKNSPIYYSVGPLLYCPANNDTIVRSLINKKLGNGFSLALCLEDTINDDCVVAAEQLLIQNLQILSQAAENADFFLPKIFIRVRSAEQMIDLSRRLATVHKLVTGFIAPKFNLNNCDAYIQKIVQISEEWHRKTYIMPILEDLSIVHLSGRTATLYSLLEKLKPIEELVLNIRDGGNDLCNIFGFRRHSDESIHKILPIANIFSDIITVFAPSYIISGPVWEYYNGTGWDTGLRKELSDDRICGFIGKTVIHPKQIPLVNEAYKIPRKDLEDANAVLGWDCSSPHFVSGSPSKERMNEYKTHYAWAMRTLFQSQIYGVKDYS